ncbi:MAG: hypothetical protein WD750_02060 [Gammaproteobacteria bacterium]
MLDPRDRHLLLESLRPPEGYTLSYAIGTSYSLDLMALLAAPLAFTFYDWQDQEGRITSDPLALLESLRRHAERIALFCHAGAIRLPPPAQRLTAYLERSVIEVLPRQEGAIFHPKIWVVRYEDDEGNVRYRFLCLSRNLTFDRSWDTVLVLDGDLEDRKRAFSRNHPLGDFLAALPGLAVRGLSRKMKAFVKQMADEVRRVRFELPDSMEEVTFWPLGLSKHNPWPYPDSRRRMLIMSPFLKPECLSRLTAERNDVTLISRADELAKQPRDVIARFSNLFTFDETAEIAGESESEAADPNLSGLHAKLVVIDDGWKARVYTGSANATNAAFNGNIEFVTELTGNKKQYGIDSLLGDAGGNDGALGNLLIPWLPPEQTDDTDEDIQEILEQRLRAVRSLLAAHPMKVRVDADGDGFSLTILAEEPLPDLEDAEVTLWPATLPRENARQTVAAGEQLAVFNSVSMVAITGFIAFDATVSYKDRKMTDQFVLNLPVRNAPRDRFENLLASLLEDQDKLLRLIWLLLQADGEFDAGAFEELRSVTGFTGRFAVDGHLPIFEELVKSITDGPGRVRDVHKLVKDLTRTDEGQRLIPEGLLQLCDTLIGHLENARE